jgi:hypothetical protein
VLVCDGLEEDVDVVVQGSRWLDAEESQRVTAVLPTVLPLRVRANPAVPIAPVEAVLDPAAATLVWVGDNTTPSQLSVSYKAWTHPIRAEDWQWQGSEPAGTPRPVERPSVETLEAEGWSGRGQPKKGTGGLANRGVEGRLQLSLGQAGADAVVAVVASKQHSAFPMDEPETDSASSQVLLQGLATQLTRPDPEQRLALVAEPWGWRLVGGEAGCFVSFLDPSSQERLARPVYVHQRTSEASPSDWGLERLRVRVDLAVAGDGSPGLAEDPGIDALRQALVETRRAFSGTHTTLRRGVLLVTQEPPPPNSDDTSTLVIWGLQEGEGASLGQDATATGDPARLGSGAVAEGTELVLLIRSEAAGSLWRLPVRVMAVPPPDR